MTLADITTEDLKAAAMRALEALEGNNLYTSGPWPVDVRPMAQPMTVIYYAADGNAYERAMTPEMQGGTLNVVLGERREVEARTLWVPVEGDVAPAFAFSAGKSTTWSGLIFRAGDYPDKGCSFAEDDLETFVQNFPQEGVPVMSEHEDSLLGRAMDRHGARLVRIWRKGGELHGEIKSPSWLDEALDGMKKSVSVGIDFAAKTLREISLTFSPRVADAAVFQHKAAVAFSHSPDFNDFAQSHPSEAASIANEARKPHVPATHMNPYQKLMAWFGNLPADQRGDITEADLATFATHPAPTPQPKAEDTALRAEVDALKRQMETQSATFAASQDETDALTFYRDNIEKYGPVGEADAKAEFSLARKVDRMGANFSANVPESEEAKLRARVTAKPKLFNMGGSLPSSAPLDLTSPTGVFTAKDFGKEETN